MCPDERRQFGTAVFVFMDSHFDIGHGGFRGFVSSHQIRFPPGIIIRIKPDLGILCNEPSYQALGDIPLALLFSVFLLKDGGVGEGFDDGAALPYDAKTDEALTPNHQFTMGGNRIGLRTLDLDCDWSQITEQLERVCDWFDK
jgi:hypothetical protein